MKIKIGFNSLPPNIYREQGLTLIEAVVSLLMFLVALGGIVPLFMTYTVSAFNNKIQTGAIAISQELLDQLRQVDVTDLPLSGAKTELPSGDPIPNEYLGREYNPRIIYCENDTFCDSNSRHIKVEVNYNGNTIYEAETIYTRLE